MPIGNIKPTQISEFSINFGFCSTRILLVALCWRNPWHCSIGVVHVPTAIDMRGGTVIQICRSVQSKCRLLCFLPHCSRTIFLLTSVQKTNNNGPLILYNIHSYTILPHYKWQFYPCTSSKLGTGYLMIMHTVKHILDTHFPENWRLGRRVVCICGVILFVGKCGSHVWEIWNSATAY